MRNQVFVPVALGLMMIFGPVHGMLNPEPRLAPVPSILAMRELTESHLVQQINVQSQDTLDIIDVTSPYYRYPGKAMMLSLAIPGAGQYYVGRPKRTVAFIGVEIMVLLAWHSYHRRGENKSQDFRDFADVYWDFERWLDNVQFYQSGPWGSGEGQIYVGSEGTHYLEFYVDMNEDGKPEYFGNTRDNSERLYQMLAFPDTSENLHVKKNKEYYENIGKYNQFFSGWDDASPDTSEAGIWIEEQASGLIAMSPNRSRYVNMRSDANRLLSAASYAVSAVMFIHVISAIDAIFVTANWNREHASRLSSRLLFNPAYSHGIGGLQLTLSW